MDVQTQAERKLTTDGGAAVLNGKADWVYGEEIFNRNGQAYLVEPGQPVDRLLALRRRAGAQVHAGEHDAAAAVGRRLRLSEGRRSEPDGDAARRLGRRRRSGGRAT